MPFGGQHFRLIGQAGVYAAASRLTLLGHNVLFPCVDDGYDLMLGNGLKIQVKCAHLQFTERKKYEIGNYSFDLRRPAYDPLMIKRNHQSTSNYRKYADIADFFILWGIDENRFWIVPTGIKNLRLTFTRKDDISWKINPGLRALWSLRSKEKEVAMEERWDLLDTSTVKNLVESAVVETSLAQKEN